MEGESLVVMAINDMLDGEGYWEGELVLLPKNVCIAAMSLLDHCRELLTESAPSTAGVITRALNDIGALVESSG